MWLINHFLKKISLFTFPDHVSRSGSEIGIAVLGALFFLSRPSNDIEIPASSKLAAPPSFSVNIFNAWKIGNNADLKFKNSPPDGKKLSYNQFITVWNKKIIVNISRFFINHFKYSLNKLFRSNDSKN